MARPSVPEGAAAAGPVFGFWGEDFRVLSLFFFLILGGGGDIRVLGFGFWHFGF